MPSAAIHMCIAKKILKKKKLDEFSFILGNIAPDSWRNNEETSRDKTHFSDNKNHKNENYLAFYNKYKNSLTDPFVLGYLTHLMTDFYYRKNVNNKIMITINGENTILKLDGTPYLPANKHHMFFYYNKVYLANRLTNYYNLKKIDITKIKNINNIVSEVNFDSITKTIVYLNEVEIVDQIIENEVFDFDETLKDIESCTNFVLKELEKLNL